MSEQPMQDLAALSTLSEAIVRFIAVELQRKAEERLREAGQWEKAAKLEAQTQQLRATQLRERETMAKQADTSWLTKEATFPQAAKAWRTASAYAESDPLARRVAGDAMDRMRELQPEMMNRYDQLRAAGQGSADAMRVVAHEEWERRARVNGEPGRGEARPQPGRTSPALPAGDLDQAVRSEVAALSKNVSPDAVAEFQQFLRSEKRGPAADGLDAMKQMCADADRGMPDSSEISAKRAVGEELRQQGRTQSGVVDDPRTPVDEHSAGQRSSVVLDDSADALSAQAARMSAAQGHGTPKPAALQGQVLSRPVAAQGFPNKLRVGSVPDAVATRQPANTATAVHTRGRGR